MRVEIYGTQSCAICQTTKRKISHFLTKWGHNGDIPMTFIDMDTVAGRAEGAFRDVTEVPTTIVWENGSDLRRWEGVVPESSDFKSVLEERL